MRNCLAVWPAGCAIMVTTPSTRSTFPIGTVRQPEKLLLVSTGNISNLELEKILQVNLTTIEASFAQTDFVEVNRMGVVVHE